ncbi:MAG: hypothetical protein CMJ49_04130 [Planctomycetaceae bacterium]|nr:hypothetical protein [Planctomycetaceae bacterium]
MEWETYVWIAAPFVLVILVVALKPWTRFRFHGRVGDVEVKVDATDDSPRPGISQTRIKAGRNVSARDETGSGIRQDNIRAGNDVSAHTGPDANRTDPPS